MTTRPTPVRRTGKKTTRLDLRAEPERAERIVAAATITHQSVSAFVLDAATANADDVLNRHAVTVLEDQHFDRLLDALDQPYQPNAALQRAATRR